MRSPSPRSPAVLLTLLVAACSSEGKTGAGPAEDPEGDAGGGCAALRAACFETQKECVEGPGRARCEPCSIGKYASAEEGSCVPIEGTVLVHDFADFTVAVGEEVRGQCQSWTLGNAEELWVNAVELEQNEQSHHSNWLFVPDDKFPGPDGVWTCKDRAYSQLEAALAGGVLYAQSTQAKKEVQKFPAGVAVRIPPYSRIIGDVHLLNVSGAPATGHVTMRVYSIPIGEVSVKLAPFHLTYETLDIPPKATSRFFGECDIDASSRQVLGTPLSMKVYFALPHTHALGSRFFMEVLGGPNEGRSIIDVHGFDSEARGRYYTPPIDMAGATGFRFGCEFENPRDEAVHWGFGDQEMCETLGFIESDMAFESRVSTVESVTATDGIPTFTGACATLAFRYDHLKAGGPGASP